MVAVSLFSVWHAPFGLLTISIFQPDPMTSFLTGLASIQNNEESDGKVVVEMQISTPAPIHHTLPPYMRSSIFSNFPYHSTISSNS